MTNIEDAASSTARAGKVGIPATINSSLAALHLFLNLFQFFLLPLYLLPRNLRWGLLLIPIAAMNNPFWALIHEAIHDLLNVSQRANGAVGRVLSIFFGSPFHVLRLTHLSHHKFNRSPLEKGTEIYDPDQVSRAIASFKYYFYILCGLYLMEVGSTMIFFLPAKVFGRMRKRLIDHGNMQEKWLAGKFIDDKLIRQIRIDGLAICLVFALSALCYGVYWILLVSLLMVRTFLISFMDNVYHYGTPLFLTSSGHNLSLPSVVSTTLLNFNLHRVHHRNPNVPWTKLPEIFAQRSERFDQNFFTAALDQFNGPIALLGPERAVIQGREYVESAES